jgi:GGDEF domain-containing protein
LGNTVKTSIRISDIAGRYGGEEFLIILPDTTINGAHTVAEKLKKKIQSIPIMIEGRHLSISASFGISSLIDNKSTLCERLDIDNLKGLYEFSESKKIDLKSINEMKSKIGELLISMADQAMYKAKSMVCTSCGFYSEKEKLFKKGNCPQCGKKTIIHGRNRIVLWEDGD